MKTNLKPLVESVLAGTASEKIIRQFSCDQLKEKNVRLSVIALFQLIFDEEASLENIIAHDKGVTLILSADDRVFQIDWLDGFGLTFAEMFLSEQ